MDIKAEAYHDPRLPVNIKGVKQVRITTSSGDFMVYDHGDSLEVRSCEALIGLVVVPASIGGLYIELRKIT